MRIQGIVALAITALAVAACGGGGGGGTAGSGTVPGGGSTPIPTSTPTGAAPAGTVRAAVSVTLPKGTYSTSSTRRAQSGIPAGTVSITFTLLQENSTTESATPQSFQLTSSNTADCTVNATTQALACVLPVIAPIDTTIATPTTDVFLAQTYDATGAITGSGAVALKVAQNSTNSATITLSANVAAAYLIGSSFFLGTFNSQQGGESIRRTAPQAQRTKQQIFTSNALTVFVIATDSNGNIILNPSAYNAPIYLQLAFDQGETPDVTLSATYPASDPAPCNIGPQSTSIFWGTIPVCSPSDVVTATLAVQGTGFPSYDAYIFSEVSPSALVPTAAPSQTPQPLPSTFPVNNSALDIYSENAATPTPPSGTLPVTGQ